VRSKKSHRAAIDYEQIGEEALAGIRAKARKRKNS
jgi:hypothetical protein